ncbi:MAG: hypothetical protein Q4P20_00095 [Eubacteriales bacterium]|nr:hypothetical protein [Eubacteriales bacterium]
MKIKITYQSGEPVTDILNALAPFFQADPHATCKTSTNHLPYYHIYVTFTPREKKTDPGEKVHID